MDRAKPFYSSLDCVLNGEGQALGGGVSGRGPTSEIVSRMGAGSPLENSGAGIEIGSGGPRRGLTCGELMSGSEDPAQRMARADVGRAAQQQAPWGFPHPHLHIVGTLWVSVWLTNIGAVAGNTRTSARTTAVPRHRPEPGVTDLSIDIK